MARPHTWSLPVLLVAVQLTLWPGLARPPAAAVPAITFVAVCLAVGAALALRRTHPVPALAGACAGIALATWVAPAGQQWFVPGDAPAVIAAADLIALFSVGARCSRRTVLAGWAAVVAVQGVLSLAAGGDDLPLELVVDAASSALVAALGRIRGHWTRERAEAARRLAAAERARREAKLDERHRLARELHDVTAHHLTSIVVNAQAATFLADRQPGLRAESLAFAARTGRETLASLHRLVEVLPTGTPEDREPGLSALTASFRAVGQRIELRLPGGEPPAELAAAMHGIAREALTNTLRYAPAGSVVLSFRYDGEHAELVIEDDGAAAGQAGATGLGGGRGVAGMRERAVALGGSLDAGPCERGWRVRARVPFAAPLPGQRHLLRSRIVVDAAVAALPLVVPLSGLAAEAGDGLDPAVTVLVLLAMVAHALPLLWRRTRPWPVFAVVAATGWLGPLLTATVLPAGLGWLFLFSPGAELVAVHAVASWSGRPQRAWLALMAGVLSPALVLAALLVTGPGEPPGPAEPSGAPVTAVLVVVYALIGILLAGGPATLAWLAGLAARSRRDRRWHREEGSVAAMRAQAEQRAREERDRMAADLGEAVLRHAAEVPAAADRGDLAEVLGAARRSLAMMRTMLDGLHAAGEPETGEVPSSSG
ncbi:histidine kinase [Actinoplanes sp. NPDC020271]|uniref:sensor histidine kinase n=1 Tax=Actinoplanes sp. NPDC020271 TaxID=3363896 RepID=UPI0037B7E6E8